MASDPGSSTDSLAPLRVDAIPTIDLRHLSSSDLSTLAALSADRCHSSPSSADLIIPKIDRSVFNESAGSRKQTYSRLRLANPGNSSAEAEPASTAAVGRHRRRPASINPAVDPDHHENRQIVRLLCQLFGKEIPPDDPLETPAPAETRVTDIVVVKRGRGRPKICDHRDVKVPERASKGIVKRRRRRKKSDDLFTRELTKRTAGLTTEPELSLFLGSLDGKWASRRKRRKIIEASELSDGLPNGWKILIGIRKTNGQRYIDCRNYISPSGQRFETYKEAISDLTSPVGSQALKRNIPGDYGDTNGAGQLVLAESIPGTAQSREIPFQHPTQPTQGASFISDREGQALPDDRNGENNSHLLSSSEDALLMPTAGSSEGNVSDDFMIENTADGEQMMDPQCLTHPESITKPEIYESEPIVDVMALESSEGKSVYIQGIVDHAHCDPVKNNPGGLDEGGDYIHVFKRHGGGDVEMAVEEAEGHGIADAEVHNILSETDNKLEAFECFPSLNMDVIERQNEFSSSIGVPEGTSNFKDLHPDETVSESLDHFPHDSTIQLSESCMELDSVSKLEDVLKNAVPPDWDAILPDAAAQSVQLTTTCVWCRSEFHQDGIDPDSQTDSIGFMCPPCKAKTSGQLNASNNDLSRNAAP